MRNLIRSLTAVFALAALPVVSQAGLFVGVSVNVAPPVLPVYVQPPCPAPGYIWMPGYWAWDDGYYWVPGTWVMAPAVGVLWTPGYWGWADGVYAWNAGYWGPHVGFYGGINYGFGYTGVGYAGGYWHGNEFYYNRSVTNVSVTNVTNVYNRTVVNNVNVTHVSFNGGAGGVVARPTPAELSAQHERHLGLTPMQRQQQEKAQGNSALRASANGGRPAIAATPRAGDFSGHGVVAARGAEHGATPVRFDRPAAQPHAPLQTHASAPAEQRPTSHTSQYAARPPEHQPYPAHSEPQHQPAPYAPHPEPQHQARPAPQYQTHSPPPPHPQRPEPRPAPQSAGGGHAGPQALRTEHGGEHNRRG